MLLSPVGYSLVVNTRTILLGAILSLFFASCALAELFQKPGTKRPADSLLQDGFRRIKLVRTIYHLVMRVKINGRRGTMIVATNSPYSQLERKFLQKLNVKEEHTGVPIYGAFGGSQEFGLATLKTFEISKAVLHDLPMAIVNFNVRPGVPHYDGSFALADLRQIGGVIDCTHRVLYFNPRGANRNASEELRVRLVREGFTRVPLHVKPQDDFLEAACVINATRFVMNVAAESFVTTLTPQTAAEAGIDVSATKGTAVALGGRMAALNRARVGKLSIGEFGIRNATVSVSRSKTNDLGIELLELNHAIIDVGALALYLKHP